MLSLSRSPSLCADRYRVHYLSCDTKTIEHFQFSKRYPRILDIDLLAIPLTTLSSRNSQFMDRMTSSLELKLILDRFAKNVYKIKMRIIINKNSLRCFLNRFLSSAFHQTIYVSCMDCTSDLLQCNYRDRYANSLEIESDSIVFRYEVPFSEKLLETIQPDFYAWLPYSFWSSKLCIQISVVFLLI